MHWFFFILPYFYNYPCYKEMKFFANKETIFRQTFLWHFSESSLPGWVGYFGSIVLFKNKSGLPSELLLLEKLHLACICALTQ